MNLEPNKLTGRKSRNVIRALLSLRAVNWRFLIKLRYRLAATCQGLTLPSFLQVAEPRRSISRSLARVTRSYFSRVLASKKQKVLLSRKRSPVADRISGPVDTLT